MYFFLLAHLIVMLVLRSALRTQLAWKKKRETAVDRRFSILIPMRNEEANVHSVLSDVLSQSYTEGEYEVIAINDHSTDRTLELLAQWKDKMPALRIINLDKEAGKKEAIRVGVEAARFPWIITIDADVRLEKEWLKALSDQVGSLYDLYILPVELTAAGKPTAQWQIVENESLIALTAASAMIGEPLMCNGANLLFSKKAYLDAQSTRADHQWHSGDDLFLLEAIKKKDKTRICFVPDDRTIARTAVSDQWLQQRIRWTGKTKRVKDKAIWLIGAYFAFMNILVIAAWIAVLLDALTWKEALLLHTLKMWIDLFWIKPMRRFYGHSRRPLWRITFFFFFPVYFLIIGTVSMFIAPQWKGRVVRS